MRILVSACVLLVIGAFVACAPADDGDSGAGSADVISGESKGAPSKKIVLKGLSNFRDLGCSTNDPASDECVPRATADGHYVKRGRLFRSEQLVKLEDTAGFRALGVRFIADFRGSPEKAGAPDPGLLPTAPLPLPIFDEAHPEDDPGAQLNRKVGALAEAVQNSDASKVEAVRTDIDTWMAGLEGAMLASYETFAADPAATKQFAKFVQRVSEGNVMSFHCASGKDRTGFAAAIVLRGIGVPWKEVMADYLRSNEGLAARNENLIAGLRAVWTDMPGHQGPEGLTTLVGVDTSYLTATFAKIQSEYGAGHPPKGGEVASDEAIAAFYEKVLSAGGTNPQPALKRVLIE
jgi:protein-tyrosine phosphatase